jgi:alkylation response protein AidB-like acyl-CoA dehydrogenase
VDFKLTEEQIAIRDMAKQFADEQIKPREKELDETGEFPRDIINKMAELGFLGMIIPEQYGGSGMDMVTVCIAAEEITKASAAVSLTMGLHNSLATLPILDYGTEEIKQKYLPKIARGEWLACFALTEPNAGSDAGNQQTTAVEDGDSYVINGRKQFITNGPVADVAVIFASTDRSKGPRGVSAFVVDTKTPGFHVGTIEKKMGISCSPTSELIFEDMRVPKGNMLGKKGRGMWVAMTTIDGARAGVAAQCVGVAQRALEEGIAYAKQRKQFGQTIAGFQLIQAHIADMTVMVEAARLLTLKAAWLRDQGLPCGTAASIAKLYASEIATKVTHKAVQIHGGYGYIKDYVVERLYRDARIMELYEGTSEIQRIGIALDMIKG